MFITTERYPSDSDTVLGDRVEQAGGVGLLPDQPGGIEQPAQAGDGGWVSMRHGRIGPRLSGEPGNWGVFYVFRRMWASIERFRTVLGTAVTVVTVVVACAGCAKSAESPVAMPGRAGAVAVAPDNYGTLWMTTPARAYRSQDGGHSWKTVAGSAGGGAIAFGEKHTYLYGALGARVGPFTGLVVRPFRPAPQPLVAVTSPYYVTHRLYALDGEGGLWLSVNVGRSWVPLRAAGLPASGVAVAARRPDTSQPDTIYVAAGPAGAVEIDRLRAPALSGSRAWPRPLRWRPRPRMTRCCWSQTRPVCCTPATTARASPGCSASPASPRSRSTPETPKTPLPGRRRG